MSDELTAGMLVKGRYRLEQLIGEGGFGIVWSATQLNVDRIVAIKFLRSDLPDQVRRRFELEAAALARLDHPNCLKLFDYGQLDGSRPYLVTEFLDGVELLEWAADSPNLTQRLDIVWQVTSALAAAHRENIIHRDLKPENIIVTQTPDGPRAKVLDFGIAKLSGVGRADVTKTGDVFGTPGYMSPEQLKATADVGPQADVYSLGAVMYELLEGKPPFAAGSPLELAMLHVLEPVPPLTADVPPQIRALVVAMLAKEPQDRPASAVVVLKALTPDRPAAPAVRPPDEPPAHTAPEPAHAPTHVLHAEPSASRVTPVHIGLAAVGALVLVLGVLSLLSPSSPPPPPSLPPPPVYTPPAVQTVDAEFAERAADVTVVEAPDLGRPDLGVGCTRANRGPGVVSLSTKLLAYIPRSYDPRVPSAALVVFHDAFQAPDNVIAIPQLVDVAEERGVVILAPNGITGLAVWRDPLDLGRTKKMLAWATDELCIDRQRVFLLGFGNGGLAAQNLACAAEGIAAVATTGYRHYVRDEPCEGATPPAMLISAMRDPYAQVDGGQPCFGDHVVWALDRQEKAAMKQHGCSRADPSVFKHAVGRCETFRCDSPLTICRIEGNRYWPGLAPNISRIGECGSLPADFPYGEQVWKFFAEHDPANRDVPTE